MRKNVIRWLILVLLLLLPAAVHGQDDISDDEVNEVAKDLYCPVCESTPLDVCPTQACADWRELIRTKLAAGDTRQDVLDYFARQYGDGVLANPPRRGVSLIVLWVLPVLLVLLGGLLFFRLLRSMRVAADPLPNPLPKGEGVAGPLPNPLPKGEGVATPLPNPLLRGEGVAGPLPSPLPKGEGVAGPLPSPLPKGEGVDESLDDYIARVERKLQDEP